MPIFGKRGKTLLTTIPIIVQGPDDEHPKRKILKASDFRVNEWEELCRDFLLLKARDREFQAHDCRKCSYKTALRLWADKPPESEAADARRMSYRCINDKCNETFTNSGVVRQSDEHAILTLIDPKHKDAVPEMPFAQVLTGFGDNVERKELITLLRRGTPIFNGMAEVKDFGMYGGAWIDVRHGDYYYRVNLGGVTIKKGKHKN
jgi:hypothetical protein